MTAVGFRKLVARIDEGHQILEFGLFLRKLAVKFLERAGLDRQVGLGRTQLFKHRALPGLDRFQRDRAVGMLRLQAGDGLAGFGDFRELARRLRFHLLHARFKPPCRHGDLGVELTHVGFDVRHQLGRDRFEAVHRASTET